MPDGPRLRAIRAKQAIFLPATALARVATTADQHLVHSRQFRISKEMVAQEFHWPSISRIPCVPGKWCRTVQISGYKALNEECEERFERQHAAQRKS